MVWAWVGLGRDRGIVVAYVAVVVEWWGRLSLMAFWCGGMVVLGGSGSVVDGFGEREVVDFSVSLIGI